MKEADVDVAAALWGGIAGAIAMGLVYLGFLGLRLTRFDLLRFAGGFLGAERGIVYIYGVIVQVVLGALVGLGLAFALDKLVGSATYVGWGLLFGLAVGLVTLVLLPLLGRLNREVRTGALRNPGLFGRAYGPLTSVAVLVAFGVFGLWIGSVMLPAA
jgi:hypothetical protein